METVFSLLIFTYIGDGIIFLMFYLNLNNDLKILIGEDCLTIKNAKINVLINFKNYFRYKIEFNMQIFEITIMKRVAGKVEKCLKFFCRDELGKINIEYIAYIHL